MVFFLEAVHHLIAHFCRGAAVQVQHARPQRTRQRLSQHMSHFRILSKDQGAFAGFQHFFQHFNQARQLTAAPINRLCNGFGFFVQELSGMIANLFQLG